jgi:hypothetical protein
MCDSFLDMLAINGGLSTSMIFWLTLKQFVKERLKTSVS